MIIGDKEYKVASVLEVAGDFLKWADQTLPKPLSAIADDLAKFPPELQTLLVKEAFAKTMMPKSLNDPDVQALIATPHGASNFYRLLFAKHDPSITGTEALALYQAAVKQHGQEKVAQAIGL
jgi:hypothetical protein